MRLWSFTKPIFPTIPIPILPIPRVCGVFVMQLAVSTKWRLLRGVVSPGDRGVRHLLLSGRSSADGPAARCLRRPSWLSPIHTQPTWSMDVTRNPKWIPRGELVSHPRGAVSTDGCDERIARTPRASAGRRSEWRGDERSVGKLMANPPRLLVAATGSIPTAARTDGEGGRSTNA